MARKVKMNKERMAGIVEDLSNGQTISFACEKWKVSRSTEFAERMRNPEYRKRVEEALLRRADMVEDSLYAKAVSGDVSAQRLFLINRAPQRWKSEHWAGLQIESGDSGGNVRMRLKEMVIELHDTPVDAEEVEPKELDKPKDGKE